ncbi:MAG: alpha-glucan family phosphorylase [Myxococcales bacterium]|nr:alpha-glucan family phosphorylase [Myxococcales bacterium]
MSASTVIVNTSEVTPPPSASGADGSTPAPGREARRAAAVVPSAPIWLYPAMDLYDRLERLALDLWWSWQPGAGALWERLDPTTWAALEHRPVALLRTLGRPAVEAAMDAEGEALLASLEARRAAEDAAPSWHDLAGRPLPGTVAYFSAEFGLHESVRIYSGGLGILAGDHVKSAADLGLPFVAVGLLYRHGYGRQALGPTGEQLTEYRTYDFADYPLVRCEDAAGAPLVVEVPMAGRPCRAAVWRLPVGRVSLYLLDTDIPENPEEFRGITAQLYGGGVEGRIQQELVLGVGGVRALAALGIEPAVFHLNEGHSSFLNLERIRQLRASGAAADVPAAIARIRPNSVFTTHTPVEAGHDRFDVDLAWRYLAWWADAVGLDQRGLMALGHWPDEGDPRAVFNMTFLAMATCDHLNGVAALHGEVSREMFGRYFGSPPTDEVPITHVTNGVHPPSWQAPELVDVMALELGPDFRARPETDAVWQRVAAVDDAALWTVHQQLKVRLLGLARAREARRRERLGLPPFPDRLDPDALTIGFARRFAPYKRADLLFSDLPRLLAILEAAPGPVQVLFAGKAHPADTRGKELVAAVHRHSASPALAGKVLLIEDYDIELGRALTQGVDVWLNNPRRPKEASGTSGMKAAMNGALNLSILDGWWPEGYNGQNGWAIGEARAYASEAEQDAADADSLYRLLAEEVIPAYFDRDKAGVPHGWIRRMKASIATCTPRFSSDRQVIDYVHHLYAPG